MSTAPRTPLRITVSLHLTTAELAAATGIRPALLARLVRLGLVEPVAPGAGEFVASTVSRLRRMLRLRADLGVNLAGAAIIVDLLERLERIEAELDRLRRAR
jgi:DNA-binding transcriptional MerR regulator